MADSLDPQALIAEVRSYLGNGGLWNPELMPHAHVRDLLRALTDALQQALQREDVLAVAIDAAEREIYEAREACPVSRRQDYLDAPLLMLANETVSQLFRMQSRAERAEAECLALRAQLTERTTTR